MATALHLFYWDWRTEAYAVSLSATEVGPPLPVRSSFEKRGCRAKIALGAAEKENWLKKQNDFQASLLVCGRQIKSSWVLLCPAWNLLFISFFMGFILREMLMGGKLWFQRSLQACAHTASPRRGLMQIFLLCFNLQFLEENVGAVMCHSCY